MASFGGSPAYQSARWALHGLTQALQDDLDATNILVQEVVLPEVESDYWRNNPGSRERLPWLARSDSSKSAA